MMMFIVITLVWFVFYYFLVHLSRRIFDYSLLDLEKEQLVQKKALERLEKDKRELKDQLYECDRQFTEVFTLYEMMENISKHLNLDKAFDHFKELLTSCGQFENCYLIEDDKFKEADDKKKVFELELSEGKNAQLVIEGMQGQSDEAVEVLVAQFSLIYRRIKYQKEIEHVAITDSLTGLFNRRYFMERLQEELKRAETNKTTLSVLMADVDFFKSVNDQYGHLTGDMVLSEVSRLIKENIREIDIPGRFGGEEFIVILPDTDKDGAHFVAERIRHALEQQEINAYDNKLQLSLSIGFAIYPISAKNAAQLIEQADQALYQAKKQGRNKVCQYKH